MQTQSKPIPAASPETTEFWESTAKGMLSLQPWPCCDAGFYFPPRPFCPACLSEAVEWQPVSGRGTLHTYIINNRPMPAWGEPYAIAVVQLEEGPRMMSNIVGIENTPENL